MNEKTLDQWRFPTWEKAERDQLIHGQSLTFAQKIHWLEQAAEISARLSRSDPNVPASKNKTPNSGIPEL